MRDIFYDLYFGALLLIAGVIIIMPSIDQAIELDELDKYIHANSGNLYLVGGKHKAPRINVKLRRPYER